MPGLNILRTGILADQTVIKMFDAVKKSFGCSSGSIAVGSRHLDYEKNEHNGLFGDKKIRAIQSADLITSDNKFTIRFRRGTGGSPSNIDTDRVPSAYFDDIGILEIQHNHQHVGPTVQEIIECTKIVQRFVTNVIPSDAGEGTGNATELLQAEISNLAALHRDMVEGIEKQRTALDSDFRKKQAELKNEAKLEKQEFESLKTNELERLREKSTQLDNREEELDNRGHMHVRRQLREQINDDIIARLKEKPIRSDTSIKGIGITVTALLGTVAFGAFAIDSFQSFSEFSFASPNGEFTYRSLSFLAKGFLASLGAAGLLGYSLSWLKQQYQEEVRITRDFERYAYDLNRASWAIETIMELNKQEGASAPDAWIEGVCRNLFQPEGLGKVASSPLEAFGTVLNASARAKIGPDGPEFEFKRGGAKKLSQGPAEN